MVGGWMRSLQRKMCIGWVPSIAFLGYEMLLVFVYSSIIWLYFNARYVFGITQGHEHEWLKDNRHDGTKATSDGDETGLEKPLDAVQMGLIYVNPVSCIFVMSNLCPMPWLLNTNLIQIIYIALVCQLPFLGGSGRQPRYSCIGQRYSRLIFDHG